MEVKDKIMFHYHKQGVDLYDDMWVVGNEIMVDENFDSYFTSIIDWFHTNVTVKPDSHLESFYRILDYYLKDDNIKELDLETLKKVLETSSLIIRRTNIFKREWALEDCRKNYFSHLPSRRHSIWLTDELQLDFWNRQLRGKENLELFKVSVTGNLFKSSDTFIPKNECDMLKCLELSKKYWNPCFETLEDEEKAEYLFQGRVKILEKKPIHFE